MLFDARQAKLLQPGQHMVIDGCQGLRLEATTSRRTWTYRYKSDTGQMKQIALGQWPSMAAAAAAAEWQRMRDMRSSGLDPRAERKKNRVQAAQDEVGPATVHDLVQEHIRVIEASWEAKGAQAQRRRLEAMLEEHPDFAEKAAHLVTRTDCYNVLDAKKATPMAAQKLRSLMGSAWAEALDAGRIPDSTPNWWRDLMRGKLKSKGKIVGGGHEGRRRRTLRDTEIGRLIAWLPNMHPLGRDVTLMYLWTCTRGVEITAMRPDMIAAEGDVLWWTVPLQETKNARFEDAVDLRVPLLGRAREVVERRLASVGKSGRLFEDSRGEQYTREDYTSYIYHLQPYSAKAKRRQGTDGLVLNVTGWTPHNLRRSARTLLASIGCPNEVGEAIVGHLPEEIVATYNAHSYNAERVHWLGRLDRRLEELAGAAAEAPT